MRHLPYLNKDLVACLSKWFGLGQTLCMLKALLSPSSRYYIRVNTLKSTRDEVLESLLKEGIKAFKSKILPEAICVPIRGPFKIRLHKKIVVVDKFTAESVLLGADVYIPGVLKAHNVKEEDIVSIVSPEGYLVAEGIALISSKEMREKSHGIAVKVTNSKYRAPKVRELYTFKKGLIYDQSLPAMITSRVLEPKPGELIVDMCAAPGGKTTHIAQLTKNKSNIIAVDRSKNKIKRLIENCERLGVTCVKTLVYDSRYLSKELGKNVADKVLLDPPCTALGVRPKIYENKKCKDILATAAYQRQLLKEATKITRKGGVIVYSTCTLSVEENEMNILYAINKLGLKLLKQSITVGMPSSLILPELHLTYVQRFLPHIHETPGYFIAKLLKP